MSVPGDQLALSCCAVAILVAHTVLARDHLTGLWRETMAIGFLQVARLTRRTILRHPGNLLTIARLAPAIEVACAVVFSDDFAALRDKALAVFVLQIARLTGRTFLSCPGHFLPVTAGGQAPRSADTEAVLLRQNLTGFWHEASAFAVLQIARLTGCTLLSVPSLLNVRLGRKLL